MSCHPPIRGEGVPLSVSNPQRSVLLVAVQAELERLRDDVVKAHEQLSLAGVHAQFECGRSIDLATRICMLRTRGPKAAWADPAGRAWLRWRSTAGIEAPLPRVVHGVGFGLLYMVTVYCALWCGWRIW